MVYRLILPKYKENSGLRSPIEGVFSKDQLAEYNSQGYNIYFYPNHPETYSGTWVDGAAIDTFQYIFADMDEKDGVYTKASFLEKLKSFVVKPTFVVDSGNGIHAYFEVSDLDVKSYLRLQRRLIRVLNTDEATSNIAQLMRMPGFYNTKDPENWKLCQIVQENNVTYTCEQLDAALPAITKTDEDFCEEHYRRTFNKNEPIEIDDKMPPEFAHLIRSNPEVKSIWSGGLKDRSTGDFRLGHIMFAHGFTKQQAASVLVNSPKALERGPRHRVSYAENIINKIWSHELEETPKEKDSLTKSVKDILSKPIESARGTRFPCHSYLDATERGFRLGQVIGLVAGSGVGKTAMALNMFEGFVTNNPDYDHMFFPLEQPAEEIAERWKNMCGPRVHLHEKVHVASNYKDNGEYRHLSLDEIKDYILDYQKTTGRKVGCVVIDHIGALKKKGKNGENQDLMDICHNMKAFAIETQTMLVMQSQAPREKAGIGDLELNKDAAYGTVYFEAYCDYLITIWQPLKRVYSKPHCPYVTAYKFCKIRHKKAHKDRLQEDVCYRLAFDPESERMRELTQSEEISFDFFDKQALNLRKADRKTDAVVYTKISWTKE